MGLSPLSCSFFLSDSKRLNIYSDKELPIFSNTDFNQRISVVTATDSILEESRIISSALKLATDVISRSQFLSECTDSNEYVKLPDSIN